MPNNYQLPLWVWPLVMLIVCCLALFRGRNEERLAAASYLMAWALSMVAVRLDGDLGPSHATKWEVVPIDVALLGVFLWIVLRTRRYWPVILSGVWLLEVVTHFVRPPYPTVTGWTYMTVQFLWGYLALLIIGYAAWTAPRYAENEGAPDASPGATRR